MILVLGQLFAIASAQNYSDAPKYNRGNGLSLAFMVVGLVLTVILIRFLACKNEAKLLAKDTEEAAAARRLGIEEIQDDHPDFMYYL